MRDKYLIYIKNKNMPVFHGAVSGVPRCGIRQATHQPLILAPWP